MRQALPCTNFQVILLLLSLPLKVAQCLNAPLTFGSALHIEKILNLFQALNLKHVNIPLSVPNKHRRSCTKQRTRGESIGILEPPLFWLDIIFNARFLIKQVISDQGQKNGALGVIQRRTLMIPSCKIIIISRKFYVNLIYRSSKLDFSLSLNEWFFGTYVP